MPSDGAAESDRRTEQCEMPDCDWPKEFEGQDVCIVHSYDLWAYWQHLEEFSIDYEVTE